MYACVGDGVCYASKCIITIAANHNTNEKCSNELVQSVILLTQRKMEWHLKTQCKTFYWGQMALLFSQRQHADPVLVYIFVCCLFCVVSSSTKAYHRASKVPSTTKPSRPSSWSAPLSMVTTLPCPSFLKTDFVQHLDKGQVWCFLCFAGTFTLKLKSTFSQPLKRNV